MILEFKCLLNVPDDFQDVIDDVCLDVIGKRISDIAVRVYTDVYCSLKGGSRAKKKDSKKKIH